MATRTTREHDTITEQPSTNGQINDMEYLMAEQRRIADAIKQAKAAMPQQSKLDKVEQKQATWPKWTVELLSGRIAARIAAGQSREEATGQVFGDLLAKVNAMLDNPPPAKPAVKPAAADAPSSNE